MLGSPHEDRRFLALRVQFEEAVDELFGKFQFDGLGPEAAATEVVGRFERSIEAASGPLFDDDGFIPPIQVCTEAEVTRWFGFTGRRQHLLARVREWIGLARAVKAEGLLLDGSFVTGKNQPGDVDAVVLLPHDFYDRLGAGDPSATRLSDMIRAREPKELFAAEDDEDWWRWFGFFSRTRKANGRYRGLIEVML
ncbi:MAG: hypothetical protein NTW96_25845 [Planctomycetia bacterium]|nr:hypothetical protein [Planctomycetia bacterium]